VIHPDEVVRLLEERVQNLDVQAASARGALEKLYETLPRLFLVESEYQLHMVRAQAEWIRGLVDEIKAGSLPGVEGWRHFHETGELPTEFT
jgi:hypothetical protein